MASSAIVVLLGVLLVATVFVGHQGPVDWLDRHLEATGSSTWLSQQPVIATADTIAAANPPASRVVDTWGVALRYGRGTVTVVPGPREGTSNVYWDTERSPRAYRFGRYGWWGRGGGGGSGEDERAGSGGGTARFAAQPEPAAAVQTRRGEDFRGGGPGSGK
jgi:hypothetical protein